MDIYPVQNPTQADAVEVPDHYRQAEDQQDWLDRCINTMPPSQLLGAMKFTIGKYNDRLGEKDSEIDELTKIINYATRYRNNLINKGNK